MKYKIVHKNTNSGAEPVFSSYTEAKAALRRYEKTLAIGRPNDLFVVPANAVFLSDGWRVKAEERASF